MCRTSRISQIDPGERVVQEIEFETDDPAFQGTMLMEWRLRSVDEGTIVEIVARNVPGGDSRPRPRGGDHVFAREPLGLPRAVNGFLS